MRTTSGTSTRTRGTGRAMTTAAALTVLTMAAVACLPVRPAVGVTAPSGRSSVAPTRWPLATRTATPARPGPGVRTAPNPEAPTRGDGVGAFRIVCRQSHTSSDDPLVHPGHPGMSHLHQFFGSRTTNAFSTTASLMRGTSSCNGGTANRSAYWSPAMVDGTGREVRADVAITYYKSGYAGIAPAAVRPMPAGLRMLAGEPRRTTRDTRPSWGRHVFWFCTFPLGDGETTPNVAEMPTCPPGADLVMSVQFPQCWDGKHLDSPDHMSHMAYPDGGCPRTHPVPIPVITENVHWKVPVSNARWRLSSDRYTGPAGRSGHADWWNGWDPAVAAIWMRRCVTAGLDCHADGLGDGRRLV